MHPTQDQSFKTAFILAIIVHSMIAILLSVKFTNKASHYSVMPISNIINATAIYNKSAANNTPILKPEPTLTPLAKPIEPTVPEKAEPKAIEQAITQKSEPEPTNVETKKQYLVKNKLQDELKQRLLLEQKQELKELKEHAEKINKSTMLQQQKMLQQMMHQELMSERQQLTDQNTQMEGNGTPGGGAPGEVDKYKAQVIQAIASQWIIPEGVEQNTTCKLLVGLAPGGEVLSVKLLASSGNLALDRSAQTAVLKASPLPVPQDLGLFNEFRELRLIVKPEGIVSN